MHGTERNAQHLFRNGIGLSNINLFIHIKTFFDFVLRFSLLRPETEFVITICLTIQLDIINFP